MDLLSTIEYELTETLKHIDDSVPAPGGYEYYNTVTIINNPDEAVSSEYGDFPTIAIYLDPKEYTDTKYNNAYHNTVNFKLECKVALDDESTNPRFDINKKMNTLLSDIKAVFGIYPTLNCNCDRAFITSSDRIYNITNDAFRVGQLEVFVTVEYSQQLTKPDRQCIV